MFPLLSAALLVGMLALGAIPAAAQVPEDSTARAAAQATGAAYRRPDIAAVAPQRAPLTLDSVYALVAARSPRTAAAAALARAARARVAGAGLPPDPELQLGFMNYMLPELRPDPLLGMTQLQVMQMVPLPGKLAAARRAAGARADAAAARVAEAAYAARAAAAMAFYERYEAEGRAAIAVETRRLVDNVAGAASAMYRVGQGRQADVLRARVELARMDEDVTRMQAMSEAAAARLAAIANVDVASVSGAPILPAFPAALPSREALEDAALTARPMLVAGTAEVRAAEADAALARRERWPDLQVGVQYGQRDMDGETDRMGSLMIGASIPIYSGSRQARMVEEAVAMRTMASAELDAMHAETRGRIGELHAALESARRLADLYRTTVLPQAEAATESALASYRTGGVDFMTVLDNRMNVNRYRQELLALEAAEGRAWAELEMLVGRALVNSTASEPRTTGEQ